MAVRDSININHRTFIDNYLCIQALTHSTKHENTWAREHTHTHTLARVSFCFLLPLPQSLSSTFTTHYSHIQVPHRYHNFIAACKYQFPHTCHIHIPHRHSTCSLHSSHCGQGSCYIAGVSELGSSDPDVLIPDPRGREAEHTHIIVKSDFLALGGATIPGGDYNL